MVVAPPPPFLSSVVFSLRSDLPPPLRRNAPVADSPPYKLSFTSCYIRTSSDSYTISGQTVAMTSFKVVLHPSLSPLCCPPSMNLPSSPHTRHPDDSNPFFSRASLFEASFSTLSEPPLVCRIFTFSALLGKF